MLSPPARMSGPDLELRRHGWFSRTGRRRRRGGRLRAHLDRMAGALLVTHGTARAQIVVVTVETAFPELDDRLFRTGRVTVIAFEAVAAGKAATGLITRLGLGQARDHLFESPALLDRDFALPPPLGIEEHRQVEGLELDQRVLRR